MKRSIFFRGFFSVLLLSLVSCGGTEFGEKLPNIEGVSDGGPGDTSGYVHTPGGDNTIVDSFTYDNSQTTAPVDILFVVDDSGSMGDNQAALASNFSSFINDFVTLGTDFTMAITTTDTDGANAGVPVAGSMEALTYQKYLQNSGQFISDFEDMIKVGTSGSGQERGLEGSRAFFNAHSGSFLRSNAYLAVIYVSDEEDQSPDSVATYANYLHGLKNDQSRVQVHSIVHLSGSNVGDRYVDAANTVGGSYEDITNNFAQTLTNISTSIINNIKNYILTSQPDLATMAISVDGALLDSSEWTYNASLNSVEFPNGLPAGAEIKVYYEAQ